MSNMGTETESELVIIPQRPRVDQSSFGIPLTFGYKGGRGQAWKGRLTAAAVMTGVLVFLIYLQTQGSQWWLVKLLWIVGYLVVYQFLMRFIVFEEHKFQRTYRELMKSDLEINEKDFWGIYEIEDEYPYFVSFNNGKRGLFIKMERGVIIGQSAEDEYMHYEAISEALRTLHMSGTSVAMLDTMESIGADSVLVENIQNAGACQNLAVREALLDMFQNLQDQARDKYTSEDTFIFASRARDINFLETVEEFCKAIMDGNYVSYEFMDKHQIRNEVRNLFNLEDFSVNTAIENLYGLDSEEITSVKVLSVRNYDGTVIKVNKSKEEIKAEAALEAEKGKARAKLNEERRKARELKKQQAKAEKERQKLIKAGKLGETAERTTVESVEMEEDLDLF